MLAPSLSHIPFSRYGILNFFTLVKTHVPRDVKISKIWNFNISPPPKFLY